MSQPPPSPDQPIVAYLGLDHPYGERYLASLASLPAAVTCVLDPNGAIGAVEFDGFPEIPVYHGLEELLEEESPDIAWITVSNRETPAMLKRVLGEGLDVFVEPPVARTADELIPIAKIIDRTDATVATAYIWRAHPIAKELRRRAHRDFFGRVSSITARYFGPRIAHRDTGSHLFDVESSRGGAVQRMGAHWIDLIIWILGERITSVCARLTNEATVGVDTTAVVAFETSSGGIGTIECGYTHPSRQYETAIDIRGSDGGSTWDPIGDTFVFDGETSLTLYRDVADWESAPRRHLTYEYEPAPGHGGRWGRAFMHNFLEARTGDTQLLSGIIEALRVLRVLDAIYRSAETGQWETVENDSIEA